MLITLFSTQHGGVSLSAVITQMLTSSHMSPACAALINKAGLDMLIWTLSLQGIFRGRVECT